MAWTDFVNDHLWSISCGVLLVCIWYLCRDYRPSWRCFRCLEATYTPVRACLLCGRAVCGDCIELSDLLHDPDCAAGWPEPAAPDLDGGGFVLDDLSDETQAFRPTGGRWGPVRNPGSITVALHLET